MRAGEEGIRFLLVSGKPIQEPVVWYGPIVMNTQDELREAFEDLEKGTDMPRFTQPVIIEDFNTSANSLGVR